MYEDCQLIPPSDDANSTKKLAHAGTTRSIGFYRGYIIRNKIFLAPDVFRSICLKECEIIARSAD